MAFPRLFFPGALLSLALTTLHPGAHAASAEEPTAGKTADGYLLPESGHVFSFPADHGSHPGFRIEWWYVTGHLWSDDQRRFGFEATFFRVAGPKGVAESSPLFSRDNLYLAHMAVSAVSEGSFLYEERLNRQGWDAGARVGSLDLTNGSWLLRSDPKGSDGMLLSGSVRSEASFDLRLEPRKPLVIFGDNSVSHKGKEASAASYYLTYSRLSASGSLSRGGRTYRVSGEAWMDHEISSSQLGGGEVGWDWISLQLAGEPRELMLYRLRHADGMADPASKLQWVSPEGKAVTAPFTWEVLSSWKSPKTGAVYPARVRVTTQDPRNGAQVEYVLEPLLADQELAGGMGAGAYWEGACRVLDRSGKDIGSAYMELTGYASPMKL